MPGEGPRVTEPEREGSDAAKRGQLAEVEVAAVEVEAEHEVGPRPRELEQVRGERVIEVLPSATPIAHPAPIEGGDPSRRGMRPVAARDHAALRAAVRAGKIEVQLEE